MGQASMPSGESSIRLHAAWEPPGLCAKVRTEGIKRGESVAQCVLLVSRVSRIDQACAAEDLGGLVVVDVWSPAIAFLFGTGMLRLF